jgi:hypothetical protein
MQNKKLIERTAKLMTMLEDRYNTRCSDGERIRQKISADIDITLSTMLSDIQNYQTAIKCFQQYLKKEDHCDPLAKLGRMLLTDFRAYFGNEGGNLDLDDLWSAFELIGSGFANPQNPSRIHAVSTNTRGTLIKQYRFWYAVKRAIVAVAEDSPDQNPWPPVLPMIGAAGELAINHSNGKQLQWAVLQERWRNYSLEAADLAVFGADYGKAQCNTFRRNN